MYRVDHLRLPRCKRTGSGPEGVTLIEQVELPLGYTVQEQRSANLCRRRVPLCAKHWTILALEAERRGMDLPALLQKVAETLCRDGLFEAALD